MNNSKLLPFLPLLWKDKKWYNLLYLCQSEPSTTSGDHSQHMQCAGITQLSLITLNQTEMATWLNCMYYLNI